MDEVVVSTAEVDAQIRLINRDIVQLQEKREAVAKRIAVTEKQAEELRTAAFRADDAAAKERWRGLTDDVASMLREQAALDAEVRESKVQIEGLFSLRKLAGRSEAFAEFQREKENVLKEATKIEKLMCGLRDMIRQHRDSTAKLSALARAAGIANARIDARHTWRRLSALLHELIPFSAARMSSEYDSSYDRILASLIRSVENSYNATANGKAEQAAG